MAYSADTFVADEQPTTAKWNKLWANDAAFNDGTGIAAGAITNSHLATGIGSQKLANPYKFFAYPTSGSVSASTQVPFQNELFDTGSNFSTSTYVFTAPVAGYYQFGCNLQMAYAGAQYNQFQFRKNGSAFAQSGFAYYTGGGSWSANGTAFLLLAQNDTIDIYYQGGGTGTVGGLSGGVYLSFFSGYIVSTT